MLQFYEEAMQGTLDKAVDVENYRNMIGSIQFLARRSPPDNMLAGNILAQYSAKRSGYNIKSPQHVFRYLEHTKRFSLYFDVQNKANEILIFHSNSDFVGDSKAESLDWKGSSLHLVV